MQQDTLELSEVKVLPGKTRISNTEVTIIITMSTDSEDGLLGANIVEACSWDLTMGAATHMIGKLFLRSTSSSSHDTPEAIDHVGIIAFNRLYEYGHNGIKKSNIPRNGEDPTPQYPGCKLRKREYLGRTARSKGEFIEWIVNVKYGEFRGSHYDMIHHNCLDFAKAVCIFLRVPPNPNWEKISNWAKNNQKLAGLFSRGSGVPGSSSPTRRRRSLQQNGRSMTIPEDSPVSGISLTDTDTSDQACSPDYATVVQSSPRRRRLSVNSFIPFNPNRSQSRLSLRSASMETLPPTYEEALKMSKPRRESIQSAAPSYDAYIRMQAGTNGDCN